MVGEEEETKKLILASSSPRRSQILSLLKLDFKVARPSGCKEVRLKDPLKTAEANSALKVRNVFERGIIGKNNLIAGFDTVVYARGSFLDKPVDLDQARHYLRSLSGDRHKVISAVSIFDTDSQKMFSNTDVTVVKFRELDDALIESYLKKEYVFDKAGAYNIMGYGCSLVHSIKGCFYNVAGLPVRVFIETLKNFDYKFL